jgi:hypothetical protein
MFIMTANVTIGPFKFKPSSLTWKRSIDVYSDQVKIVIPSICNVSGSTKKVNQQTAQQFSEGMKVTVNAGYDGSNELRFMGFIARINYTVPLELECEGYAYQLRKKLGIKKTFIKNTKLKDILSYLVEGTDIKLSDAIPDVIVESSFKFPGSTGTQALDLIKDNLKLTVYFNYDTMYVGLREIEVKKSVKFRLGWNVIKDNDLKFAVNREFTEVRFELKARKKDGTFRTAVHDSKYSNTKVERIRALFPQWFLDQMAADKKKTLINTGYEGVITAFLIPYVEPGMAAVITDQRYPERNGKYFIEAVEGEFSTSGGRQKIKIGSFLGNL